MWYYLGNDFCSYNSTKKKKKFCRDRILFLGSVDEYPINLKVLMCFYISASSLTVIPQSPIITRSIHSVILTRSLSFLKLLLLLNSKYTFFNIIDLILYACVHFMYNILHIYGYPGFHIHYIVNTTYKLHQHWYICLAFLFSYASSWSIKIVNFRIIQKSQALWSNDLGTKHANAKYKRTLCTTVNCSKKIYIYKFI